MFSSVEEQKVHDLLLEKYTYGGDALGRLDDGRAVFVPFGLPGERVRVQLTEEKRGFTVSAVSFFQVNTVMAEIMVDHLLTCLPVSLSTTLLDVYCGVGLFSAFFAPECERVIGIESSPSACEDFAFNLDEFENVELYEGPAEDVIPHLEAKPDLVVVDPPRAGLERRVADGILKLNPRTIAYVSCDPSTLARDASRLIHGGYCLKDVTPFDLFPQTYHIESIGLFER